LASSRASQGEAHGACVRTGVMTGRWPPFLFTESRRSFARRLSLGRERHDDSAPSISASGRGRCRVVGGLAHGARTNLSLAADYDSCRVRRGWSNRCNRALVGRAHEAIVWATRHCGERDWRGRDYCRWPSRTCRTSGGPDSLNRISASLSGTSAGVRLPRGAAAR
jgi:hypothetical protein